MTDQPVLHRIPEGYIPLSEYCRAHGISLKSGTQAAAAGNVPGAVRVHLPGYPKPRWWIPADSTWRPNPRGKHYERPE